jgi:hypothetical protein
LAVAPGTVDADGWQTMSAVEIWPDGLQLQQPASLVMEGPIPESVLARGELGLSIIVGEDGNPPGPTSSRQNVATGRGVVRAQLSHFSRYERLYGRAGVLKFIVDSPSYAPLEWNFFASAMIEKPAQFQLEVASASVSLEGTERVSGSTSHSDAIARHGGASIGAHGAFRCTRAGLAWLDAEFRLQGAIAHGVRGLRLAPHTEQIEKPMHCHDPLASSTVNVQGIPHISVLEASPGSQVVPVGEARQTTVTATRPSPQPLEMLRVSVWPRDVLSRPRGPDGLDLEPSFAPFPFDHVHSWWTHLDFPAAAATRTYGFQCLKPGNAQVIFSWRGLRATSMYFCRIPGQEDFEDDGQ